MGEMTITITAGWWLVPLVGTIVAFACAYIQTPQRRPPTGYGNLGDGIVALVLYGAATVISLVLWLIWAVMT